MTQKKFSYNEQSQALDEILAQLQSGELDVDAAIALYEKGVKLVDQLEAHVQSAQNKITRVTLPEAGE